MYGITWLEQVWNGTISGTGTIYLYGTPTMNGTGTYHIMYHLAWKGTICIWYCLHLWYRYHILSEGPHCTVYYINDVHQNITHCKLIPFNCANCTVPSRLTHETSPSKAKHYWTNTKLLNRSSCQKQSLWGGSLPCAFGTHQRISWVF